MGDEGTSSSAESELEFDSVDDELLYYSRHGDVQRVHQLLKKGCSDDDDDDIVDINCKGSQKCNRGWTPLHLAAYFGHDDVVRLLLEEGCSVGAVNGTGDSPLHKAALTSRESVVTMLLQYGADVFIVNREAHTPKQLATSPDVIRLIEAAEKHDSRRHEQEVLEAAADGNVEEIKLLLQGTKPPSLGCTDRFGNTPLHIGALRGKENVVVFLLQHGISTNNKNNNGQIAADMTQSYHMKQLLGVKPVKTFQMQPHKMEGQLLKKSRILGFRPVWVVIDKGVLSYFENRGDAATGSKRKGMKYLDEAQIYLTEKEGLDFKICFSDGTSHVLSADPANGAQLIKQKWMTALKEHIQYSTHYIHTGEVVSEFDTDKVTLGTMQDTLKTAEAHQKLLESKVKTMTKSIEKLDQTNKEQPSEIQRELKHVLDLSRNMCQSLSDCMTLFNQQHDLRELQLKEEMEKCRVLQDALHVLATEHHELERSITSQGSITSHRSLLRHYDTDDDEFYECDDDDDEEYGSQSGYQSFGESFADAVSMDMNGSSPQQPGRTSLPVPMFSRNDFSFWSILKQCIGKELSKITMPVIFNEPLSFIQRISEYMEYAYLLERACQTEDPTERMQWVTAFVVSSISSNWERIGKPFNPLLGETYELDRPDLGFRLVGEQVSHHPPITAFHVDSQHYRFHGSINAKLKFWGKSVEIYPKGMITLELLNHNEIYTWHNVNCCVHNVIVGKLWVEHYGTMELLNHKTKTKAVLNFREGGWFGKDLHRVEGYIYDSNKMKIKALYGNWVLGLYATDPATYDMFVKNNTVGTPPQLTTNGATTSSATEDEDDIPSNPLLPYNLGIPEEECLWKATPKPPNFHQYFAFSTFAMQLNELKDGMCLRLPDTDARLRPDIRLLEEGNIDSAAEEKNRMEEKQRAARKERKKKKEEWNPKWFKLTNNPATNKEDWMFTGEYWVRDWKRCPNIF